MKQKRNSSIPKAIIPCSGRGTRMGSPKDGKEMLKDPKTGKPLIYWPVMKALRAGFEPVLIINSKKTKLKNYLIKEFGKRIKIVIHDPQPWEEWPNSVLSSQKYWGKWNVLMLPDTRFSHPIETLKAFQTKELPDIMFATHKVDDGSKFGVIFPVISDIIYTAEKPKSLQGKPALAWGLIGFTKEMGTRLFKTYAVRGVKFGILLSKFKLEALPLVWFKDITRTGVLERYPSE